MATNVLSNASGNRKTKKSLKSGQWIGRILYLSPANVGGMGNLCPASTPGCRKACLYTAGHGRYQKVHLGRLRKTTMWFKDRPTFWATLHKELTTLSKSINKSGKGGFVRLNGTSDIAWEKFTPYDGHNVMEEFPELTFYDYTKIISRALNNKQHNYHLTFSRSESNQDDCIKALQAGVNVSVVFAKEEGLPKTFWGFPVVDGDKNDLQFLIKPGHVLGLVSKGRARYDKTGFVVRRVAKAVGKVA